MTVALPCDIPAVEMYAACSGHVCVTGAHAIFRNAVQSHT